MNYKMTVKMLGRILLCLSGLLVIPLIVCVIYNENVMGFSVGILVAAALGLALTRVKPDNSFLFAKEGFIIVGAGWLLISLIGALPFVVSGYIPNYIDAFFETVSGFTTTGASILTDVESLGRGVMFWRLFTHWIGGMGVLVFLIAILPMNDDYSMHIMRAEVPGPSVGKLVPRAGESSKILYIMYFALTACEIVALKLCGFSFYDALVHSFATAGTGGFSTRAASIGAFNNPAAEIVIAVFMILFGVNFNLYYFIVRKELKKAFCDEELRWYLGIIASSVIAISIGISRIYGGFMHALRYAFFNVATIISTTGFGDADFTKWPEYCKCILVLLMLCGACAGSTGGGIKVSRVIVLFKSALSDLGHAISPRRVSSVFVDKKRVPDAEIASVSSFLKIYFMLMMFGTLLISFDGYDFTTNLTAAISCLSNIGPGLGLVGPAGSFSIYSGFSKLVLSFCMLAGRLELYPMLILFYRKSWKKL